MPVGACVWGVCTLKVQWIPNLGGKCWPETGMQKRGGDGVVPSVGERGGLRGRAAASEAPSGHPTYTAAQHKLFSIQTSLRCPVPGVRVFHAGFYGPRVAQVCDHPHLAENTAQGVCRYCVLGLGPTSHAAGGCTACLWFPWS